jgi:FOG: EAL domain
MLALKNEEFKVFLQPKYLLKDETIGGAEALVRWINNGKTVSTPNIFIPIFEQTRFILKFDMYMFENVCKLIRTWIDENKKLVTVSVNFSRLHFANKNFVNDLCSIADKYSVPHNLLEIEITESAVISNISALEEILNELHKQNFTFSIDDFGTGYSSLGMLKDISVDVIKIDKSFFDKCESDERARMVIDSVMKMTKPLKICTVAEGIEEKVYIDFLKKIGCDMVQGFYYSKPIPAEEFTKTKI